MVYIYQLNAAEYCADCIVAETINVLRTGPEPSVLPFFDPDSYDTAESALDTLGPAVGIDREDERSYDSGEFPKVSVEFQAQPAPDSEEPPRYCETCLEVF